MVGRILAVGEEFPPIEPAPIEPAPSESAPLPREMEADAVDLGGVPMKGVGRWSTLNTFVDAVMQDLTRIEVAVWLILFRDTRADGLSRTAYADLARRAGANVRSVTRAVASLRAKGLLRLVYQGGLHRGVSLFRVKARVRD